MSKIEVIGLGALNVDKIYQVERILEDGETIVKDLVSFPGGSAANTIYGLAKLGVNTGFIGAVGDDADGKSLLQDFQNAGVDTRRIKVKPEAKTGSALCLSDELGRRSIYLLPGANNLLTMNNQDFNYINQAKLLHVSSFVDDRQFKILLELMDKLGSSVKVSFSPGMLYANKGLKNLGTILARTHVLFTNRHEIRQLTGCEDISTGAEICLGQGCRIIVVTLGEGVTYQDTRATSYIMSEENEYLVEAAQPDIQSLDTIGAGDAFTAGFLYGLLKSKNPEECGRLGDIVARFSISKTGARQGLPTLDKLAQRYRQLHNKQL